MRIYSERNKRNFIDELKNNDWYAVYNNDNPNLAYDNFKNTIHKCYEKCLPLKPLSRKRMKDKPLITVGLKI